jgi:hypothetical protein
MEHGLLVSGGYKVILKNKILPLITILTIFGSDFACCRMQLMYATKLL